ncbi:MAG: superoxide dismutase [Ruminococcaceae bacterium]|nr:superoxide dismutase [Oscillospiraceae bacterium]
MNEHFPFQLPSLPYPEDALVPILSKETLYYHHDKHFANYIDTLNKIIEPFPRYHTWTLAELYQNASMMPPKIRDAVLLNAGGVLNHDLYFRSMIHPQEATIPRGALRYSIDRYFGSFAEFLNQFISAAEKVVGSGWLFLASNQKGKLFLVQTQQQYSPLSENLQPLLALDLWEHAYYLQYKNDRKGYINAWPTLINWDEALKNYRRIYAK